jgi:hypothetical protein
MLRKRKSYWIIVDDKFIKGWRKLDLCETKDEAHIWKSEKSVNKYRDIVSEKYPENEVLVNNNFEVVDEEQNLNPDEKESKDKPSEASPDDIEYPIIADEDVDSIADKDEDRSLDGWGKVILNNEHKEFHKESEVKVEEGKGTEIESISGVEEEKSTKTDEPEEVKTFKEYLNDDEELKDDDFDFDIDV